MTDNFPARVQRQIDRLQHCSYRDIEAEVAQKRRAWFKQHPLALQINQPTPRQAFELLFFDYMGLSPADLPIVSESDNEIVWQSRNPCPTLVAVQALGLDTRTVCRATTERSTQAFLSHIDPQLRFLRSYETIRPYADHCREMIVRVDFAAMMRLAIQEAQLAGHGAVVVLGRRILSRAHDTAVTQRDPGQNRSDFVLEADDNPPFLPLAFHTQRAGTNLEQQRLHAEVNAIQQAQQVLADDNLSGALLFSTCEPCPACYALAVEANLTTIVYGTSRASALRQSHIDNMPHSDGLIEVIGGIVFDEGEPLDPEC